MNQPDNSACLEVLLDVICHEVRRKKLSREMEHLFLDHLTQCVECRTKVLGFMDLLGGWYMPFKPQVGATN